MVRGLLSVLKRVFSYKQVSPSVEEYVHVDFKNENDEIDEKLRCLEESEREKFYRCLRGILESAVDSRRYGARRAVHLLPSDELTVRANLYKELSKKLPHLYSPLCKSQLILEKA